MTEAVLAAVIVLLVAAHLADRRAAARERKTLVAAVLARTAGEFAAVDRPAPKAKDRDADIPLTRRSKPHGV